MTNEGDGGAGGAPATLSSIAVKFTSSDKAAGRISISLESTIGAFKEAIRCVHQPRIDYMLSTRIRARVILV